ncbi:hypothetical protein AALC25_02885 [Lachnospiraceae bacterium 29-84]
MQQANLFENLSFCSVCRTPLPTSYEGEICPTCMENQLFNEVKEYIRSNDVTEYQVAEHFKIPQRQVKKWITEGRIEYKEEEQTIAALHCSICGEKIAFGTLCQKCYHAQHDNKAGYAMVKEGEKDKMRFMEDL